MAQTDRTGYAESSTTLVDNRSSQLDPKPPDRRTLHRVRRLVRRWRPLKVAGVLAVLLIWSALTYSGVIGPKTLPSPTGIVHEFIYLSHHGYQGTSIAGHTWDSLRRALIGFCLAGALGVPIGILTGYYRWLDEVLGPIFGFLRPIPPISFIPLAVLYLGIGELSKIVLIFGTSFLYVVLNTQVGVRSVPEIYLRVGRNIGLTRLQLFTHIIMRAALPSILGACRVAIAMSWTILVAAELLAAQSGLGFMIHNAGMFYDLNTIYVGILIIGVVGVLLDRIVVLAQIRLLRWQGK